MNLTDISPIEKWIEFEKKINAMSGLDCNVFNPDGYRITTFKSWANRLCPVIKADPKGQSFICAVAHMNIAGQTRQSKSPAIEECDAGLLKVVVPIFFGETFLGAVGACGLLPEDGEIDSFMINKTINIPEEDIEQLSDDIPVAPSERLKSLIEFIQDEIQKLLAAAKV